MKIKELINYRLVNQQLTFQKFKEPAEVVAWLSAMQAQDFAMAKWAIGLRLVESTHAQIQQAFNEGKILRTHLLRPTWHFVAPVDIRWILALTAPRIHSLNLYYYKKFELTGKLLTRSNDIIARMLQGGKHLTRPEIKADLERSKIVADGLRLSYIMMHAELDGIICSGPVIAKQFSYSLLEERVSATASIPRDEALIMLASRYFTSRGPATMEDFMTWSSLTKKDAGDAIANLPGEFQHQSVAGKEYIFTTPTMEKLDKSKSTFLMPDYDEYAMGYKDRSVLFNLTFGSGGNDYSHWIIIEGQIGGTWKATVKNNSLIMDIHFFSSLPQAKQQAVKNAVKRYCSFVGNLLASVNISAA